MQLFYRAILFFVVVCFFAGCSSSENVSCPTDKELLDRFTANSAKFEELLVNRDNQMLQQTLHISRVTTRSTKPLHVLFEAWSIDFFGPGGCLKGYAYSEAPPLSKVDSIDQNSDPGSPEEKELYRHIQGNWYLYYISTN